MASYTDVELGLLHTVHMARRDFDTVFKVMYRTRGETQRIHIADAMGRQFYKELKLETEFAMGVGAARHCLKIRNQYSHCAWWDDNTGHLAFADLEEIAFTHEKLRGLDTLTTQHVDVELLTAQEAYFGYAEQLLGWVNYEGRMRDGVMHKNPLHKPKQLEPPALHIL